MIYYCNLLQTSFIISFYQHIYLPILKDQTIFILELHCSLRLFDNICLYANLKGSILAICSIHIILFYTSCLLSAIEFFC